MSIIAQANISTVTGNNRIVRIDPVTGNLATLVDGTRGIKYPKSVSIDNQNKVSRYQIKSMCIPAYIVKIYYEVCYYT